MELIPFALRALCYYRSLHDKVSKGAQERVQCAAKEESNDGAGEDDVGVDKGKVGGGEFDEARKRVDAGLGFGELSRPCR